MRTSFTQFVIFVEFMENYGDLSKPCRGPNGRQQNIAQWNKLTGMLNADGAGETRSEDKWRKVWSDFKNNTKKKAAKINRSMRGTGGGPPCNISLSDLEQRVITIMGEQAATGIPEVPEAGFEQPGYVDKQAAGTSAASSAMQSPEHTIAEVWNLPGTSSGPTPSRYQAIPHDPKPPTPPAKKQNTRKAPFSKRKGIYQRKDDVSRAFLENETRRDEHFLALEREKIRQRDQELNLQTQWLELMREALMLLRSHLGVATTTDH